MPSPRERRRNNVRTGLFVSVTLILAVIIIVVLSGVWRSLTMVTRQYTVEYPVDAGVSNLKPGADVRIGGMTMGQVSAVRAVLREDVPFETIAVDFTLDQRVRLYSNARVFVTAPLIGSDAWLDITSVGHLTDEDGRPIEDVVLLEEGGRVGGTVAAGLLSTLVGADNADQTGKIIENVNALSEFLAEVPDEYEQRIVPILENAGRTMEDASATAAQVREDYEDWRQTVDRVMEKVNSAAENLDVLMADAQEMIEKNSGSVDTFVENMRGFSEDAKAISARVEGETIDKVHQLLDRGNEGIDSFASVMEELQVELDAELPNVRETLANARLASQQLKLTMIEVRRSPWKVLYRPSPSELEHELLYEAARSFAVAASDLKASSDAMNRVLARHGDQLLEDRESFEQHKDNLLESFRKYDMAQQALFGVLIEENPQ